MNLSEMTPDEALRSFCIDASAVIGEAIYEKPVAMSFSELEVTYIMLTERF